MTNAAPSQPGAPAMARDPVVEAYKSSVDRSLLRQNLRRSPSERLENLQALLAFAEEVRSAGREARERE